MICRAKFTCNSVEETEDGSTIKLWVVTSGSEENERFFSFTPCGEISMGTLNPNVKFEVGKEYFVDFYEAEQPMGSITAAEVSDERKD